jgi:Fungal Zn(2)-Cys(6) binuclear cluster domain
MAEKPTSVNEDAVTSGAIKRITKACGSCRQSKVRCDGKTPCSRCHNLIKACNYAERPRDLTEERFERLEQEILNLRSQLDFLNSQHTPSAHTTSHPSNQTALPLSLPRSAIYENGSLPNSGGYYSNSNAYPSSVQLPLPLSPSAPSTAAVTSPLSSTTEHRTRKRKRSQLEVRSELPVDFVSKGLLNEERARQYFNT